MWVCSWGACAFSLSQRSVLGPAPPCLEYCFSVVLCAVWEGYVSCFVLGSLDWLGNSESRMPPHNVRISGSNFVNNVKGNLIFIVFFTLSHNFFETLWTVACQAALSMWFPRQAYWRRLPYPSPGDLHAPGTKLESPALAGGFFTTEPPGNPYQLQPHDQLQKWQL